MAAWANDPSGASPLGAASNRPLRLGLGQEDLVAGSADHAFVGKDARAKGAHGQTRTLSEKKAQRFS